MNLCIIYASVESVSAQGRPSFFLFWPPYFDHDEFTHILDARFCLVSAQYSSVSFVAFHYLCKLKEVNHTDAGREH